MINHPALRILPLALVALGMSVSSAIAADRITALVTITNAPTTNGMTFLVNSDTRTWTNSVFNTATQILTNDSVNGIATNLFNHLAATPPLNVSVSMTDTNVVRLAGRTGSALSVTGVTNYFSVTYSTQTVASAYDVIVPYTSFPSSQRQTITEGLVDWLNLASGKALFENSASVSNLVGLTNSQTISGPKTFSSTTGIWYGIVSNSPAVSGTLYALTNGTLYNVSLVGAVANFSAYMRIASGSNPQLDFANTSSAQTNTIYSADGFEFYLNNFAGADFIIRSNQVTAAGNFTAATNISTELGSFYGNASGLTNLDSSTGIRYNAKNTFPSGSDIAFNRYALTSLANGNNAAVPLGTNVFVQVSGPSAAFTLNGLDAQPNRDGALRIVVNLTGQNMTIAHDSGVDPTAANRIYTMTGADVATTGNGTAMFIYSASASRWICLFTEL
jgi:hypothetical protein